VTGQGKDKATKTFHPNNGGGSSINRKNGSDAQELAAEWMDRRENDPGKLDRLKAKSSGKREESYAVGVGLYSGFSPFSSGRGNIPEFSPFFSGGGGTVKRR